MAVANVGDQEDGADFKKYLNPDSLQTLTGCLVEPSLGGAPAGTTVQFLRHGYFCVDKLSAAGELVFNRAVGLRDSWAKIQKTAQ
jgi:glutaminyl-tRNA synthetase